jgi:hypothetical protein
MRTPRHVDAGRRRLFLGGASLASLSAAGCSTVPSPQIPGLCLSGSSLFLGGAEVQAAWGGKERYFDAHTHFFNASDVPVAGFLAKSVAHSIEDSRQRQLLIELAPIAELVGKTFAPTPVAEMERLCESASRSSAMSVKAQSDDLDRVIDNERERAADAVFDEIRRRDTSIPAIVNDAVKRAEASNKGSLLLKGLPGFNRDFVRESFRDGSSLRDKSTDEIRPLSKSGLTAEELQLASIQSAFQFVGFMLSPRHHNLRTYIKRFAEGSPKLPLSGCFGAMVDFNYWLDAPTKASHMRDQVLLHEQIALLSGGFLLPLVAYNPWVDLEEDDAGLKTVEWAVKYHGCVGVKIYPPMGFYPYGNADNPLVGSTEKRPDLKKLDEKLGQFYALCRALDVPVMAHANESNGRDFAHDKLAGIKGWNLVDQRLPNLKALYVNAGHFGGAEAHHGADWTADFTMLMNGANQLKVYGDIGYWDALLTPTAAQEKLRLALQKPAGVGQTVADRTMYGSDWLMLSLVAGWEGYADGIASLIRGFDQTGSIATRVLGMNVLDCYGLVRGSSRQNSQRLQAYYSQPGRTPPGWSATVP